jgi:hypothetical protein
MLAMLIGASAGFASELSSAAIRGLEEDVRQARQQQIAFASAGDQADPWIQC